MLIIFCILILLISFVLYFNTNFNISNIKSISLISHSISHSSNKSILPMFLIILLSIIGSSLQNPITFALKENSESLESLIVLSVINLLTLSFDTVLIDSIIIIFALHNASILIFRAKLNKFIFLRQ